MIRTVRAVVGVAALSAALVATGFVGGAQADKPPKNLRCDGVVVGGKYHHVRVPRGESCKLVNAVVTGNFRARKAIDVKVLDTRVRHNLMIVGARGEVKVGNKRGCRFDPIIGNNVVVRNSHNVLLCQLSLGNNLTVRNNDGRITVRDNRVDNNIRVNRNDKYNADGPAGHRRPGAIRLIRNKAGNHVHVFRNHRSRDLILRRTSPAPTVK